MKNLNDRTFQELLALTKHQAEVLRARSAAVDGMGARLLAVEAENAKLGSMLLLAVRGHGGRFEVSDNDQQCLPPTTALRVEEPIPGRDTWLLIVDEAPEDVAEMAAELAANNVKH